MLEKEVGEIDEKKIREGERKEKKTEERNRYNSFPQ